MFSILQQIDPTITINYLILGYGVMWGVAAIYVAYLYVQQRNLEKDIALMRRFFEEEINSNSMSQTKK